MVALVSGQQGISVVAVLVSSRWLLLDATSSGLETRSLSFRTASIRLARGHDCETLPSLTDDEGERALPTVGGTVPRLVGLGCVQKQCGHEPVRELARNFLSVSLP